MAENILITASIPGGDASTIAQVRVKDGVVVETHAGSDIVLKVEWYVSKEED